MRSEERCPPRSSPCSLSCLLENRNPPTLLVLVIVHVIVIVIVLMVVPVIVDIIVSLICPQSREARKIDIPPQGSQLPL